MKRHQLLLTIVLLVQLGLSLLVFWPRSAELGTGQPLLPNFDPDDIVYLSLMDDAGQRVTLRRQNGEWVLPEVDDYPVRAAAVEPVLSALANIDTQTLVARTAGSHVRLQVAEDDFVRRLLFERSDGSGQVLYLGSAPRYNAAHVRLHGEDEVYLTNSISSWELDATPSNWVDTGYFRVEREALMQVTLENSAGTLVFLPQEGATDEGGSRPWTLQGLTDEETLNTGAVNTLLNRATAVTLLRPLGKEARPAYGMEEPRAVVTLETAEEAYTLTIGAYDPATDSYVVKASNSPYYARVTGYNVQVLVENAREDFLEVESDLLTEP